MLDVIREPRGEQAEAGGNGSAGAQRSPDAAGAASAVRAADGLDRLGARRATAAGSQSLQAVILPKTAKAQAPAQGGPGSSRPVPRRPVLGNRPGPVRPRLSTWSEVATAADRVKDADRRADRYAVEIHKKWAISLACISFVHRRHRDGAPVPPGRHRAGDRGRARGILHPLRGPHGRGEPGRPGPRIALGRDVDVQHRADGRWAPGLAG